eukprot:UN15401
MYSKTFLTKLWDFESSEVEKLEKANFGHFVRRFLRENV